MTVRRLRKNQRGPWCSYCEEEKTRAVWRGVYFSVFACSKHRENLEADDRRQTQMDLYETEAEASIPWV